MFSIILPTYNERESIVKTIKDIKSAVKTKDYEIIVVDDNSPDKTWDLVKKTFKDVHCLRRMNKKGLSSAIIDGFIKAKGEYLFVMDADGQHDEKKLQIMFEKIKDNDIVIGTRFRKGGSVEGWSKLRILISKTAAMLAKPFLSNKITDPMSGFFGIKKSVFMKYKDDLDAKGYKILLEILFQSKRFKIEEVPFKFKTRKAGKSKLSFKVMFEYLIMLAKHAITSNLHFIPFSIVGLSGVLVNTGMLYLLTEYVGLYYLISAVFAIETSIITNFLLNNAWTWRKRNFKHSFPHRFFRFNLVSIIALSINLSILFILTHFFNIYYIYSNLIGIACAFLINYFVNDRWTFDEK
jgi:dolichol-phosphate mannosyltransferase